MTERTTEWATERVESCGRIPCKHARMKSQRLCHAEWHGHRSPEAAKGAMVPVPVVSEGTQKCRCMSANGRREQKYTEEYMVIWKALPSARLAQSVERKALNLVVVGSSPTVGAFLSASIPYASSAPHASSQSQWVAMRSLPRDDKMVCKKISSREAKGNRQLRRRKHVPRTHDARITQAPRGVSLLATYTTEQVGGVGRRKERKTIRQVF